MGGMREGEGMSKVDVAKRAIRRLDEVEEASKELRGELNRAVEGINKAESVSGTGGGDRNGVREGKGEVERSRDPRLMGRKL